MLKKEQKKDNLVVLWLVLGILAVSVLFFGLYKLSGVDLTDNNIREEMDLPLLGGKDFDATMDELNQMEEEFAENPFWYAECDNGYELMAVGASDGNGGRKFEVTIYQNESTEMAETYVMLPVVSASGSKYMAEDNSYGIWESQGSVLIGRGEDFEIIATCDRIIDVGGALVEGLRDEVVEIEADNEGVVIESELVEEIPDEVVIE